MENIGEAKNEIAIVDKETVENLIYIVRGQKVILDVDLARIYGYETRRFNEQVKNNSERFDDDFRFQLTKLEFERGCREIDSSFFCLKFGKIVFRGHRPPERKLGVFE